MKKIYLLALCALSAGAVSASTEWTVSGTKFKVDTLFHANIGPGTTQTELDVTCMAEGNNYKNRVFYTTVDLKEKNVELRVVKAQDNMQKKETVSAMAIRKSEPGAEYFAGVNADFFGTYPISTCISHGSLTNFRGETDINHPVSFVMTTDKVPYIVDSISSLSPSSQGVATYPSGATYNFEINHQRWENQLIIYTPQLVMTNSSGKTFDVGYTGQNEWGAEVQIRPVSNPSFFGQTTEYEVVCEPTAPGIGGNMKIPADGFVLSGHGTAREEIQKLKIGDRVKLNFPFVADGVNIPAQEVVGGFPVILRKGEVLSRPAYPEHLSSRQPRTAVGYNADKSKVVMAVVDGRNKGVSEGVYTHILAGFMQNLGCVDAMNFDGGGSSTLYVHNLGVRNTPCNTNQAERAVVNGLFAVSVAPEDDEVASIELKDKVINLTTGDTYRPIVYGYNQYGLLVRSQLKDYTISVPEQIASVDDDVIVAKSGKYSGMLTVEYEGMTHSVPVYLNGGGDFVSGITEIVSDDADVEAEYYTLQGIKVINPEKGQIVIVRRGSNVTKEIVK